MFLCYVRQPKLLVGLNVWLATHMQCNPPGIAGVHMLRYPLTIKRPVSLIQNSNTKIIPMEELIHGKKLYI